MPAEPESRGRHQPPPPSVPVPGPANDVIRDQPIPFRFRADGTALLPALEGLGRTGALPRLPARAAALSATST
jgi:hypothetical protein